MTSTEILPILKEITKRYEFSSVELDALRHVEYIIKKKAEEEKREVSGPSVMYYVGEYRFKRFKDALLMAKNNKMLRNSFILEKRLYENGVGVTKKYTLSNGQILGVKMM